MTDSQTDGTTDRQNDRQLDRRNDRQTGKQTVRHTHRHTDTRPSIHNVQSKIFNANFDTFQITTFALFAPFMKDNCKHSVLPLPKKQQS